MARRERENEISSGAVIGYVLVGFALLVLIAFCIFAISKKVGGDTADTNTTAYLLNESNIGYEVEYNS